MKEKGRWKEDRREGWGQNAGNGGQQVGEKERRGGRAEEREKNETHNTK